MSELYIGLMSGTSLDGIDAALVEFKDLRPRLLGFEYHAFPENLKTMIHRLSDANSLISLQEYGELDVELGHLFAQAVSQLLIKNQITASAITAIGSHGQTLFHAPNTARPFSLQIGDPNIIAETTGVTTVADFRRRDIAAGGQGAPLVPAFHQAVFSDTSKHRCIVNIGGIANITVLPTDSSASIVGFDTGPGNTLMDQWIKQHKDLSYDASGAWARTGRVNRALVAQLEDDEYFYALPPKSTGKEYFSLTWLAQKIAIADYQPEDIQASLCYLTAITICKAIKSQAPLTEEVLVCGGGIHNTYLLELITQYLACPVASTEVCGIHPDHVEAMAFAWLARQTINHLPGNLKEVTGAKNPVVLGGVYPGRKVA